MLLPAVGCPYQLFLFLVVERLWGLVVGGVGHQLDLAHSFLTKGVPRHWCSFPSGYHFAAAHLLSEGLDTSEKNRVVAQPVELVLLGTKI